VAAMTRLGRALAGVLVVAAAVVSVSADERLVDVQSLNVRGHRQRLVSGSSRREVYRTTYTRETAAHGRRELVPEVININIEKHQHQRTCIPYASIHRVSVT